MFYSTRVNIIVPTLFIYPPVKYHYQLHMQLQCITVKYEASSETAERY